MPFFVYVEMVFSFSSKSLVITSLCCLAVIDLKKNVGEALPSEPHCISDCCCHLVVLENLGSQRHEATIMYAKMS